MATASEKDALGYNLQVDYVVCYSFADVGQFCESYSIINVESCT